MAPCLVGRLASWFIGCLLGRSVGCLVGPLIVRSWLFGCLVGWLFGWLTGRSVGRSDRWWLGWLFGWLWFGWLVWLNPPMPGPKPRGPPREGSGRGPKINDTMLFYVLERPAFHASLLHDATCVFQCFFIFSGKMLPSIGSKDCTKKCLGTTCLEVKIEQEVAAWRCFFMRACFSLLGVTLFGQCARQLFIRMWVLSTSIIVVCRGLDYISPFYILLAGQHHGTECEPDEKLLRRFLGAHWNERFLAETIGSVIGWLGYALFGWLAAGWVGRLRGFAGSAGWLNPPTPGPKPGAPTEGSGRGPNMSLLNVPNVFGDFVTIETTKTWKSLSFSHFLLILFFQTSEKP